MWRMQLCARVQTQYICQCVPLSFCLLAVAPILLIHSHHASHSWEQLKESLANTNKHSIIVTLDEPKEKQARQCKYKYHLQNVIFSVCTA